MTDIENWQRLLECPDCDTRIVCGEDNLYGGTHRCYDCETELEVMNP